MSEPTIHDVIIVGSGPAGYTAAIYTARAGLNPIVLAGSVTAGGALMNTTDVENFPGFPEGVMGPDLMTKMQEQAERFGAQVRYEDVTAVSLDGAVKTVEVDDEVLQARAVILATGSAYRELGLEGEKTYAGRGVSYCATCDGFFFRDKPIVVVGGGDSAMEEATFLSRFGSSVTVVHRRDELRASKVMADRAQADPKISFAWNSEVVDMHGDGALESITLRDTVTGQTRQIPAAGVFVAIGHVPRSDLVADQLELEGGYIRVDEPTTATSVPGVFACGDVVDHRYRQAITAAGSGCRAALDAQHYLEAPTPNW
ncbi:MAG: thioredoxin-disulfide reductase [Actinomycetaceae bacterium]|nr:thioredoxin-disulfide reductase [Actinomycetaceae bacterium]